MNKTIGLGLGDEIDLWVEVLKETPDRFDFNVINGQWDGYFTPDGTLICYEPFWDTTHKINKYFLDPIPDFGQRNYTDFVTQIKIFTLIAYVAGTMIGVHYDTFVTWLGIAIMFLLGWYLDEIFPETKDSK